MALVGMLTQLSHLHHLHMRRAAVGRFTTHGAGRPAQLLVSQRHARCVSRLPTDASNDHRGPDHENTAT